MNRKDTKRIKQAVKARLSHVRKAAVCIHQTTQLEMEHITKGDMERMRSWVEQLNQAFHEFNAYRNAYNMFSGEEVPDDERF